MKCITKDTTRGISANNNICDIDTVNNKCENANCSDMCKCDKNEQNKELKVNNPTENNKNKKEKIINKIGDFLKWCRTKSDENEHTINAVNNKQISNKRKTMNNNQDDVQLTLTENQNKKQKTNNEKQRMKTKNEK